MADAPEDFYIEIPWSALEMILANLYEVVEALTAALDDLEEEPGAVVLQLVKKPPPPEQGH